LLQFLANCYTLTLICYILSLIFIATAIAIANIITLFAFSYLLNYLLILIAKDTIYSNAAKPFLIPIKLLCKHLLLVYSTAKKLLKSSLVLIFNKICTCNIIIIIITTAIATATIYNYNRIAYFITFLFISRLLYKAYKPI
jgi:hypothetical protein